MAERERLAQRVEELVWWAMSAGQMMADPMTPEIRANEIHAEVWRELQEVLRMMEE